MKCFLRFIILILFFCFVFSPVSCSSSDVSSECQHSDVSSRTTTNTAVAAGGTSSGGVQNYHFGSVLSGEELYIEVGARESQFGETAYVD